MRYEWTGTQGQALYVEAEVGEGALNTNAGPDDLEAHAELIRLAEENRRLREELDELQRTATTGLAQVNDSLNRAVARLSGGTDSVERHETTFEPPSILAGYTVTEEDERHPYPPPLELSALPATCPACGHPAKVPDDGRAHFVGGHLYGHPFTRHVFTQVLSRGQRYYRAECCGTRFTVAGMGPWPWEAATEKATE
jgi:hypothetical protein